MRLEVIRDAVPDEPITETIRDQPVTFDPAHRQHTWRPIVRYHTELANPRSRTADTHDPMALLGG